MGYEDWFVDSEIIAPGSADQGFEGRNYFRPMRLHEEAFVVPVQTKAESLAINIDPLVLSKVSNDRKVFVGCINNAISAVREGGLKRHFSAEREILKLMFAFDHINYAEYIAYQHVYLNNLLRKDNSIVKDLITNRHRALCFGDMFSTIHRDLVTEHFNKKQKELLCISLQVIVLIFIYAVNKWIKTFHIHSKMRAMLR